VERIVAIGMSSIRETAPMLQSTLPAAIASAIRRRLFVR
jgi:hypothetical protein